MSDFFAQMYNLDENILIIVAMMCMWATLIINKALDHMLVTLVSLPAFLNFSLATIVILDEFQILLSFDKSLNLIMGAGLGIILALIAMVVVFVVATTFIDAREKLARKRIATVPAS